MSDKACRHSMEPHENCCLCENEKLRADREALIEVLKNVNAWLAQNGHGPSDQKRFPDQHDGCFVCHLMESHSTLLARMRKT